jgi:hypothetical protein
MCVYICIHIYNVCVCVYIYLHRYILYCIYIKHLRPAGRVKGFAWGTKYYASSY